MMDEEKSAPHQSRKMTLTFRNGSCCLKRKVFMFMLLLIANLPSFAEDQPVLIFGIVPQQSASKLAQAWGPLLKHIGSESGVKLRFATAPDIPTFEQRLAAGKYDFAYMNPYHYTIFSQTPAYQAIAHAEDKLIRGIVVTHADSPHTRLEDLADNTLAFPSPAAFAASILTRNELMRRQIPFTAKYVSSHDSVYRSVAKGLYPAGGGVIRTLNAVDPEVRKQLRVLWTTPGYTPHAIAAHPRVPEKTISKIQTVMMNLDKNTVGRSLLKPLNIKGWQAAQDSDWDKVRALDIKLLDVLIQD